MGYSKEPIMTDDTTDRSSPAQADFAVRSADLPPFDRDTKADGEADADSDEPGRDLSGDVFKGDERAKE
jgi:hypothetical protein